MNNVRIHGDPPYQCVLLHGGPGAMGEMASLAEELSSFVGIIEPLQTQKTIQELIIELDISIDQLTNEPITLVGYSWGAWLGVLLAAQKPEKVKKLILVSSGPFEESYAPGIMEKRYSRLSYEDKETLKHLQIKLRETDSNKNEVFNRIGHLISRSDAYSPLKDDHKEITVDFEGYQAIWPEASRLRKSGRLLEITKEIHCPVIVVHGDYDPHPIDGVVGPLSRTVKHLKFKVLNQCGHKPWNERHAKEIFIDTLVQELNCY